MAGFSEIETLDLTTNLQDNGFSIVPTAVHDGISNILCNALFSDDSAGERCLLDHPTVRETALTLKQGIHYARPPESVLNQLLAVRLHLDDCDATNGPLRISPGTHLAGILKTAAIPEQVVSHGEITCLAKKGEILLMRPLVLHASSQATEPKHRRILHLVYHTGEPIQETWHRAI